MAAADQQRRDGSDEQHLATLHGGGSWEREVLWSDTG